MGEYKDITNAPFLISNPTVYRTAAKRHKKHITVFFVSFLAKNRLTTGYRLRESNPTPSPLDA